MNSVQFFIDDGTRWLAFLPERFRRVAVLNAAGGPAVATCAEVALADGSEPNRERPKVQVGASYRSLHPPLHAGTPFAEFVGRLADANRAVLRGPAGDRFELTVTRSTQ